MSVPDATAGPVDPNRSRPGSGGRAWPTTTTRLIGLLGHPVAHSLSPVLHNAALAASVTDLAYLAFDVVPDRLSDALTGLEALGVVGVNVTVPHKTAVVAACASLSDEARAVGAVNTLTVTPGGLVGHNTDTDGFLAGLPDDRDLDRAVVLGTGGAARAVVVALARRGTETIVVGRRAEAVADLVTLAAQAGGPPVSGLGLAEATRVERAVTAASLVVNTTPLGLHQEPLPDPFMRLQDHQVAYDLIYNPTDTPFLVAAATAGAHVVDGLAMLVGQAAASLQGWVGRVVDPAIMLAAAREALADKDGGTPR